MKALLRKNREAGDRTGPAGAATSRAGDRFRAAVESGVLGGLLLMATVSAMVGSATALLCAVVGAWLALTAIVGPRNVLDAGCYFMLLVVGVLVVVDLAITVTAAPLP